MSEDFNQIIDTTGFNPVFRGKESNDKSEWVDLHQREYNENN